MTVSDVAGLLPVVGQPIAWVWVVWRVYRLERVSRALVRLVIDQSPALSPELRRFAATVLGATGPEREG